MRNILYVRNADYPVFINFRVLVTPTKGESLSWRYFSSRPNHVLLLRSAAAHR